MAPLGRSLTILLVIGLVFLGSQRVVATPSPSTTAIFCPQCWVYLTNPGAIDLKGNCAICGKYPVELEVAPVEWFWCTSQSKWLSAPCARSREDRCCSLARSTAVIVSPSRELITTSYCPADRSFQTLVLPFLGTRVCSTCGRPAVDVTATRRAWYWCNLEGIWGPELCPQNAIKKCCEKFEGVLLAKPEMGPIAN